MRFCSGVHIEPEAVDEAVIDRYMDHRARTTARASDDAARRILARLWNGGIGTIEGWPPAASDRAAREGRRRAPRGMTSRKAFAPTSSAYFAFSVRMVAATSMAGQRRPCKSSTLTTRKRELVAAVRMAVKVGVPLANLTSLRACFTRTWPRRFWTATGADGEIPKTYTINLSCRFVRHRPCGEGWMRMTCAAQGYRGSRSNPPRGRNDPEEPRPDPAGADGRRMVAGREAGPTTLMRQARRLRACAGQGGGPGPDRRRGRDPDGGAVRLGNLASIRLGENLIKPGGPDPSIG